MIRTMLIVALAAFLFSCGNVKNKKLTQEVWEQIKTGRELRGEQQAYLNAFIFARAMESGVLDMSTPFNSGITVKEAIEEGRKMTIAYRASLRKNPGKKTTTAPAAKEAK